MNYRTKYFPNPPTIIISYNQTFLLFFFIVLGGHIHIRLDVVLSIIVPDMVEMIDQYSNALLNYCTKSQDDLHNNSSLTLDERKLKPIQEQWRKTTSKRGHGHYSKAPEQPVFTDLVSSLLVSRRNVNIDLKLPSLSPEWFSIAIGLFLSTGNTAHGRLPIPSSSNASPLLDIILTFIEEWLRPTATNSGNARSTRINFSLPTDELNDFSQRSTFILEHILIPLLPCYLIVNKVYLCKTCQSTVKMRATITSIPVNVIRSGLHLENALHAFFAPTASDIVCVSCNQTTVRHIEVVEWPQVLIVNVNDSQKHVKSRKPPGALSLAQFSSWFAIGSPSSCVYDLTCFNSIIRSGTNDVMVRVTKIKKSWSTNINKRLIGEGEQLRRLFAHCRKLSFYFLETG